MLNKICLFSKILFNLICNNVVSNKEFSEEYDAVAGTYDNWINKMGKYTDNIINIGNLNDSRERLEILDFACGNGYISKQILQKKIYCFITAVDISRNMIDKCKRNITNRNINFINDDGINFLKNQDSQKYDAVFCGWALPYFDHKYLLQELHRIIKNGGIIGIISNSIGTLNDIEEIFLDIMAENRQEVIKPMDTKLKLPNGEKGLIKWFENFGFKKLVSGSGEEKAEFNSPEELYKWLRETGALAGAGKIFKSIVKLEDQIVCKIADKRLINGKYVINHKFAYGIFEKI